MNRVDYENVVRKVRDLLSIDSEWKDRYKSYACKIGDPDFRKQLERAVKQFKRDPFQLYLPVSTTMKCNPSHTYLDLRFHGQSVATLRVDNRKEKTVELEMKSNANVLKALTEIIDPLPAWYEAESLKKTEWVDWHDDKATEFRKLFFELEKAMMDCRISLGGQPEHEMESWLLANYSKKSADEKEVVDIQPVKMPGTTACFQMPTPIKACKAKDGIGNIEYSKQYGGGIDILARMGRGKTTKLAILELKDEFSPSEPPEKAICQAIAYATFIRELVRDPGCGEDWWRIFGFGGKVPKELKLLAVIVMPYDNRADKSFVGEGPLDIDGDSISLGYIYRNGDSIPSYCHLEHGRRVD